MADLISNLLTSVTAFANFFLKYGNIIYFWLHKFSALITIWYFGGKLAKKFETKLNPRVLLLTRIVSGIGIYLMGVVVSTRMPFLPSLISEFTGAFIIYLFFKLFASMITRGIAYRVVGRDEFSNLSKRVDKLEALMERIVGAITDKKIMPEKLDSKSCELALKKILKERKKISDFVVLDSRKEKDNITFIIKSRFRSFKVVIDIYSGELLKMNHLTDSPRNVLLSFANLVYENKIAFLGAFLLVLFVNFTFFLDTSLVTNRILDLFSMNVPAEGQITPEELIGGIGLLPSNSSNLGLLGLIPGLSGDLLSGLSGANISEGDLSGLVSKLNGSQ